jgi:PQQ-like domain
VFLLNGRHLGGIGKQQAELGPVCTTNIDGGSASIGMTAYLPCEGGVVAVKAARSPPALHLLWNSGAGGGPPIVAGGLVWTIGQNGKLYGLDPATGKIRQQAAIGTPANHFPTPGIGAGLLLAPGARNVVAFRTH